MPGRLAAFRRPPVAALLYGLLLAGMATGQLASVHAFREALASYDLLGPWVGATQFGLPALEALVAVGLLLSSRLPSVVAKAAGLAGVLVALLWAALAAQAFARGFVVENCGCFGAYLTQELRWWVLLEDAYMLLLALLAASSLGIGMVLRRPSRRAQPASARSPFSSRSITRPGKPGSAGGSSRPTLRSESSVASNDR
jgi:Methylamine utilisation protein MauE